MKKYLQYTKRPALYDRGTAVMWTDSYISEQLLQIHLDPELDLASRKYSTIESTADWIFSKEPKEKIHPTRIPGNIRISIRSITQRSANFQIHQ